jgi:hypothetical protein
METWKRRELVSDVAFYQGVVYPEKKIMRRNMWSFMIEYRNPLSSYSIGPVRRSSKKGFNRETILPTASPQPKDILRHKALSKHLHE